MNFNQLTPDLFRAPSAVRLSGMLSGVPVVQMSGPVDAAVAGVTTDSRAVRDRWLFAAVEGEHTDGHLHVQRAVEQGASCVVVQLRQYQEYLHALLSPSYAQHHATTVMVVHDSREAIGLLSDRFYGSPARSMRLIGISGTNGKTTTSFLVKSILEKNGERVGLIGTIFYQIGKKTVPAPFTTPPAEELHRILAEMRKSGCSSVVMEVSSHALALKRVFGLTFDASLFTNLTQDHLDFHGTMEAYAEAKATLFRTHTKDISVFNADDPWTAIVSRGVGKKATFGTGRASYRMQNMELRASGIRLTLTHKGDTTPITSRLVGSFNAYNIGGAVALAAAIGIPEEAILKGIRAVKAIPGRFERIRSQDGVVAVVDYSHTPDSLTKAIATARELAGDGHRVLTVFGCGGDRDKSKRPRMGEAASGASDVVFVTSDNPRSEDPRAIIDEVLGGIVPGAEVRTIPNRKTAIRNALRMAANGDVVLVAGKGHETYQITGTTRAHFDDREIIREYFAEKRGGVRE